MVHLPKSLPVGQIPAGLITTATMPTTRGRRRTRHVQRGHSQESSPSIDDSIRPQIGLEIDSCGGNDPSSIDIIRPDERVQDVGMPIASPQVSSQADTASSSASKRSSDDAVSIRHTSPTSGRGRKKLRYSTPGTIPPSRGPEGFNDYKELHMQSPDTRLAGDISSFNPPPNVPSYFHQAPRPTRTPGIEVKSSLRGGRRVMSDEDGYYTAVKTVIDLPRHFDELPHDYKKVDHIISSKASIEWIDNPGLVPSDIRARRLRIYVPPEEVRDNPDEVIWRVTYACNGCCSAMPPPNADLPALGVHDTADLELVRYARGVLKSRKKARSSKRQAQSVPPSHLHSATNSIPIERVRTSQSDSAVVQQTFNRKTSSCASEDMQNTVTPSSAPGNPSEATGGWKKEDQAPKCGSYLTVEMTNAQSQQGLCTMRLKNTAHHPLPREGVSSRISPYARHLLHETATVFSMTKGRLKDWWRRTVALHDQHVLWLSKHRPGRLPKACDWASAMSQGSNSSKIHRSPLAAMEIIAARNPDSIIAERGPKFLLNEVQNLPRNKNSTEDTDRMECVIAPPIARVTAILQVFRQGMYMDSSGRHKNAYGCPVTMLVTLNNNHHMVPLAAMVSAHSDHIAYEYLLREFNRACKETAQEIVDGHYSPKIEGVSHEDLVRQCRVVAASGLRPAFMMIDRSNAERMAIENVLPDCPIRICQFHFMQALRAQIKKIYGRSPNRETLTQQVLEDIRLAQRCDDEAAWPEHYANLERSIRERTPDDTQVWPAIDNYLQANWFSPVWGRYLVDFALPPNITRDGPWSTNNYTEACFRTFDRVFLCCRVNRRLDRLLIILIDAFFPFYEAFGGDNPARADPNLQFHLFGGLQRWENGCIHPCPLESVPPAHQAMFGSDVFCAFPPQRDSRSSSTHYCGRRPSGREVCTCNYPASTGKRCLHLWAMVAFELLGSVFDFEENAAVIDAYLRKKYGDNFGLGAKSSKHGTLGPESTESALLSEVDDEAEFKEYWGKPLEESRDLSDPDPRLFPRYTSTTIAATAPTDSDGAAEGGTHILRRFRSPRTPSPSPQRVRSDVTNRLDSVFARQNRPQAHANTDILPDPPTSRGDNHNPLGDFNTSLSGAPAYTRPLHPTRSRANRKAPAGAQTRYLVQEKHDDPAGVDSVISNAAVVSASNARIPRAPQSSLALRQGDQARILQEAPAGIINTGGRDCYITSLLQVFLRVDTWCNAFFSDWAREKLNEVAEFRLLCQIKENIDRRQTAQYEHLRQIFRSVGLINNATAMGDPMELYDQLFEHMDRIGQTYVFKRSQAIRPFVRTHCAEHDATCNFEDHSRAVLHIHPLEVQGTRAPTFQSMLDTCVSTRGVVVACCEPGRAVMTGDILTPVVAMNVVWGLRSSGESSEGSSAIGPQVDTGNRRFDIPRILNYGESYPSRPLKGIICRHGFSTNEGHYTAIVRDKEAYWHIDDHRVRLVGDVTTEAFKNGSYPVFIVYEPLGGEWFTPPTPPFDPRAYMDWDDDPTAGIDVAESMSMRLPSPCWSDDLAIPLPGNTQDLLLPIQAHSPVVPVDSVIHPGSIQESTPGPDAAGLPEASSKITVESQDQGIVPVDTQSPITERDNASGDQRSSTVAPAGLRPVPQIIHRLLSSSQSAMSRGSVESAAQSDDDESQEQGSLFCEGIALANTEAGRLEQLNWESATSATTRTRMLWATSSKYNPYPSAVQRNRAVEELAVSLADVANPIDRNTKIRVAPEGGGDLFGMGLNCGIPNSTIPTEDFDRFKAFDRWLSSTMCDAICTVAGYRIRRELRLATPKRPNPRVKYLVNFMPWQMDDTGSYKPVFATQSQFGTWNTTPWPALGTDSEWRSRVTLAIINSRYNNHFVCVAIFGPARLVIPFDGVGGAYDDPVMTERWPYLLRDRLDWELAAGLVESAENDHWIFAPNTTRIRDEIGWVKQANEHSCGPLACAAAILIMQGLRPCATSLGLGSRLPLSEKEAFIIRDCLLILVVEEASMWALREGRPLGRLANGKLAWRWITLVKLSLSLSIPPHA